MKKMQYGNFICNAAVAQDYVLDAQVCIPYDREVVAYAVERFLTGRPEICREFTRESFDLRIRNGRGKKVHHFTYLIPGRLMELPLPWTRVIGTVDRNGVEITRIDLLGSEPAELKSLSRQQAKRRRR